jgi:glycosyltransferase involved in cell wall biosynthesis
MTSDATRQDLNPEGATEAVRILLIGGGVHPIPPTGYGAVERILADLRDALAAAGHEAVILNRVRHRRMRDEYPFAWELPRLLRKERYDVLHANTPVVANRLAFGGFPFVYTSHSRHWYYRDRLSHRWGYWLERRAVRGARAVVALTEPLARTMRSAVRPPLPPISVVPFGVDSSRFRPAWDRRVGSKALGVGVVAPFKRWHLAAQAMAAAGGTLTIAGPVVSPAYAEEVRRGGANVRLLGEVPEPELATLFAESDFLLHPSAVEILSATVLEALAAGLPVVGGAGVEGVVDDGVTGWRLDDRDPATFTKEMGEKAGALLRDEALRRRMGEAARQVAQDRYGWPGIVARHLEIYRAVAESAKGGSVSDPHA